MTAKMERFVQEYLVDFNATQAAVRAGYSKRNAGAIGNENLQKPEIQEAIEKEKRRIVEDIDSIVFGNIRFWLEMRDNPKTSDANRLKATEYLGKYGAMFTEKIEATGDIIIKTDDDDDAL
jgi:phage terminase small subunit